MIKYDLNINDIHQNTQMNFKLLESVDSTNKYIILNEEYDLVISKMQTMGQGTKNRQFVSSYEDGLYFSMRLNFIKELSDTYINFYIGNAIVKVINDILNEEINLKWVNDLYYDNRKLGGILIQRVDENVIIGIGINIRNQGNQYSYLNEFTLNDKSLNEFVIGLVNYLKNNYKSSDLINIHREYCRHCFLIGMSIKVFIFKTQMYKIFKVITIDKNGNIVLYNNDTYFTFHYQEIKIINWR